MLIFYDDNVEKLLTSAEEAIQEQYNHHQLFQLLIHRWRSRANVELQKEMGVKMSQIQNNCLGMHQLGTEN